MENAWNEYTRLEKDVDWLKSALQGQMNRHDLSQVYLCSLSLLYTGFNQEELQIINFKFSFKAKRNLVCVCSKITHQFHLIWMKDGLCIWVVVKYVLKTVHVFCLLMLERFCVSL